MKTKQRPTATVRSAVNGTRLTNVRQLSKEEESLRLRQRQSQSPCNLESTHDSTKKETEAQVQQKIYATLRRPTHTSASMTATTKSRWIQKPSKEKQKKLAGKSGRQPEKLHMKTANAFNPSFGADSSLETNDAETAQLRLQLEHLAQLSEQDFEREFRQWLSQEGIDSKIHAHLRMDLINSFSSTSLGNLLSKAGATAAQMIPQQNCLHLSPMALALHSLVAEFLYEQNCHYTLSVFCSEMQHRQTLPDFEGRTAFRFSQDELQRVVNAVLGDQAAGQKETQMQYTQTVLHLYDEQQQSLLLALLKTLVDANGPMTHRTLERKTVAMETEPAAYLQSCPDVDTSQLYQVKELIVAADVRTVFSGPSGSKSLNEIEEQLTQLMQHLSDICKSCAPPVEIISPSAFEQLLQQELLERQRLLRAGQSMGPGQTAIPLPISALQPQQPKSNQVAKQDDNKVLSPAGPIHLPAESPTVPKLPNLHAEQVASLAMVQQTLHRFRQHSHHPQAPMYVTLERLDTLLGELAGCVQALSNLLNLAMEQECAVGRHQGYKLGYREGFTHGHFMGVQEGMHSLQQREQKQLKSTSSQTRLQRAMHNSATQTKRVRHRDITTCTECLHQCLKDVAGQTPAPAPTPRPAPSRRYDQWIYEMLHSNSGHIFLERVELSLNKALELQKQRLDEIYEVKLSHHAELMRLSDRQGSWRALCNHVERDLNSIDARKLVHKIFHLLEHYEAQHQLLAEKIQQTEIAADQAVCIQPVWTDAEPLAVICHRMPTSRTAFRSLLTPRPVSPTQQPPPSLHPRYFMDLCGTAVDEPRKPQFPHVATNTTIRHKHTLADASPQAVLSLNEALLSAKERMLQLEQDSDLLEQSFFVERVRAQNQKLNIGTSCGRKQQQIHRTLKRLQEWQQIIQLGDVLLPTALPPVASSIYSSSELDQESHHFTNAITVARRKLFPEQSTSRQHLELELKQEVPAISQNLLVDQVQTATRQLLSRVEATLAHVGKPASPHLLSVESQLPLLEADADLLSSVSLDTMQDVDGDCALTPPASCKLQRSMAKMQKLFDSKSQAQVHTVTDAVSKPATRLWRARTERAHTAPISRPNGTPVDDAPVLASNLLSLLDGLSDLEDKTGNSNSLDTHHTAMHHVYEQLVDNALSTSPASPRSLLLHSVEFWNRMNL